MDFRSTHLRREGGILKRHLDERSVNWLREVDSNHRPFGYEPNELPTAPSRKIKEQKIYTRIVSYPPG